MSDPLIVVSRVKDMLKASANVKTVSAEVLDWIDAETQKIVERAIAEGKRTDAGKLLPPGYGDKAEPESKEPERIDARAKETRAENGGKRQMCYALVEVLGGVATVSRTVGAVEVVILDRDNLKASLGIPECGTEIMVLCDDLHNFAKVSKFGEYAELANEIQHKHEKLLKEFAEEEKKKKAQPAKPEPPAVKGKK